MNKKTLSNYILAFDEINALTAVSYNTASETTEDQTVQVSQIADDILSLLINAYRKGVQAASEMLAYDLTVDVRSMRTGLQIMSSQEIYRGYRLLLNLNFTEYTTLRFWMEDTSTNPVLDMG